MEQLCNEGGIVRADEGGNLLERSHPCGLKGGIVRADDGGNLLERSHPCGLRNCVHRGVAESVADRQRKVGSEQLLVHGQVDGAEAGCEDMEVSDVAVGEVGKGDAVRRRRQVLHPKLQFSLKICRILLASDAIIV
jgi:hypothetical protein